MRKILHIVFGLCMVAGIVMILGTAGSSDLGMIDFNTILVDSLIGLGVTAIGYIGLKLTGADCII